jgi:hypothetical protein
MLHQNCDLRVYHFTHRGARFSLSYHLFAVGKDIVFRFIIECTYLKGF